MGYCVSMQLNNVVISAEKAQECLLALNTIHESPTLEANASGGSYAGGKKTEVFYAWVDNPPATGFPNLVAAFGAWRYDAAELDDGNIQIEYFNGEKWGDDEFLFRTIAPYVVPGASIEVRGDDDCVWRYRFHDGRVYEDSGEVVFETSSTPL